MTADFAPRNYNGNAVKTNLTTGMTNADNTTTIADSTGWPLSAFWMVIDAGTTTEEVVYVATRASLALSGIARNVTGAGAFAHSAGGTKTCWPTGTHQDFQEANAVASALTTKGDSLWKGGTPSVAPARLAAGTDQQIIRYKAANSLGVETTHLGGVPVFTTTGNRDAAIPSPVGGQTCYIFAGAATDGLYTYNGVSWRPAAWDTAWGVVAQASSTSSQTGITTLADITFATATWTAVSNRLYRVTLSVSMLQVTTNGDQDIHIVTGASGAGTDLYQQGPTGTVISAAGHGYGVAVAYQTGSGSTSVHGRAHTSAGTLTIENATSKGWFVVEDVGPIGVPA